MREVGAAAAIVVVLAAGLVFASRGSDPQPGPQLPFEENPPPPPAPLQVRPGPQGVDAVSAVLTPWEGATVTGTVRGEQKAKGRWTVTVKVHSAEPNADYSVIVVRTGGDPGTPGPTPCTFTTDASGAGGCTGEMDAETLANANVMGPSGAAAAHGTFTPA